MMRPPTPPRTESSDAGAAAVVSPVGSPRALQRQAPARNPSPPPTPPPPHRHGRTASNGGSSVHSLERSLSSSSFSPSVAAAENEQIRRLSKTIKRNVRDYGAKHASTVQLRIQMGNVCFRHGDLVGAANAYKKAVEACDSPGEPLATAYLNLGTVYWRSGEISYAIHCLERSLQVLEMVDTAAAASSSKPPPQQQRGHTKTDESSSATATAASAHHQLGLCHSLNGDWTRAMASLERAKAIRSAAPAGNGGGGGPIAVAQTVDAMGQVHRLRGEHEAALACHDRALALLSGVPGAAATTVATLLHVADAHAAAARPLDALEVLHQSRALQLSANVNSNSNTAAQYRHTLDTMAQLYDETGYPQHAAEVRLEADRCA